MTSTPAHSQLNSRIPAQRNQSNTKRCEHDSHRDIRKSLGILSSTLEVEATIIASKQTNEADKHLPKRRMNIEIKLALEVMRTEFAKVCLVPDDHIRLADAVEARPARQQRVDSRW